MTLKGHIRRSKKKVRLGGSGYGDLQTEIMAEALFSERDLKKKERGAMTHADHRVIKLRNVYKK